MSCHGECLSTRGTRNSGHSPTCVDSPQRHVLSVVERRNMTTGECEYSWKCSTCGTAGVGNVEADIRAAHPEPVSKRGPTVMIVKEQR